MAILDTNCDPASADFPVPGNDDATRAISLYCELLADAILDGMTDAAKNMGVDFGASANPVELAAADMAAMEAPAEALAPAPAPTPEPAPAENAAAPEAASEFKDDLSLIDGVGPVYKSKLEAAGVTSLKQIAELDGSAIEALETTMGISGKIVSGEWVEQAKELLSGKPPRAKSDAARA